MQIPINKLAKMLRTFPQWSTAMTITFCLYLLFIMVVLSISFPLKSHKTHLMSIERNHVNENTVMDIVNDNDALGDSEEKLMQRAKNLPTVSNRSEILRDAFNKWVFIYSMYLHSTRVCCIWMEKVHCVLCISYAIHHTRKFVVFNRFVSFIFLWFQSRFEWWFNVDNSRAGPVYKSTDTWTHWGLNT